MTALYFIEINWCFGCHNLFFCHYAARTADSSDIPLCGGHLFGRGGPAGPQRVTADVSQPAAAQRPGGPHHVRPHGPGS